MRSVTFLIILHLGILASGTWAAGPAREGPWIAMIRDGYQAVTGAGGGWGFFSPNVGNQVLVEFELEDGEMVHLQELVSPEVALRVGNMYRLFVQSYANEKLKRAIAASLSAQIFRRFPDAKNVTMIASVYKFPGLDEFRAGARPETKEVYRIKFAVGGPR